MNNLPKKADLTKLAFDPANFKMLENMHHISKDLVKQIVRYHNKTPLTKHMHVMDEITDIRIREAYRHVYYTHDIHTLLSQLCTLAVKGSINPENIILPNYLANELRAGFEAGYHDIVITEHDTIADMLFLSKYLQVRNSETAHLVVQNQIIRHYAKKAHAFYYTKKSEKVPVVAEHDYELLPKQNEAMRVRDFNSNQELIDLTFKRIKNAFNHKEQLICLQKFVTYGGMRIEPTEAQAERIDHYLATGVWAQVPGSKKDKKRKANQEKNEAKLLRKLVSGEKEPAEVPFVLQGEQMAKVKQAIANDTARNKSSFIKAWQKVKFNVTSVVGAHCSACGVTPGMKHPETGKAVFLTGDHVFPFSKFVGSRIEVLNCQMLCEGCNTEKGNHDTTDFRTMKNFQDLAKRFYGYAPTTQLQRNIMMHHIGLKLSVTDTAKACDCTVSYVKTVINRTTYNRKQDAMIAMGA